MTTNSRLPGFHSKSIDERRRLVARAIGRSERSVSDAIVDGGFPAEQADKTIENVLGTYSLPFAIAPNFLIDGQDYLVPMVIEEPSVVAAAANAARMIRAGGGFVTDRDPPHMVAQIQLWEVTDATRAAEAIAGAREELLQRADLAVPNLVARGGGARDIFLRDLGDGLAVVHVVIDVRDAMGANLVNTVAETLADRVAVLTGGEVGLRILSNLSDDRCVRVTARVPVELLATESYAGPRVRDRIVAASRFAERDPYRAATHNKGIMNGVDAVVMATANDWRAIEAGAHAFAARSGRYTALATWHVADDRMLEGRMEIPLALGTVGGTQRVHRGARLALEVLGVSHSDELAAVAASAGLASNLAALRALATEGIQRGHMALHARAVATAAGAAGDEVERVAAEIARQRTVTLDAARRILASSPRPENETASTLAPARALP